MAIGRLKVSQIRNIETASLDLSPQVNLIHGPNGSGKTSLLESAHFLSRARSFRNNKFRTLINEKQDSCAVYGEIREKSGVQIPVGVQRSRDGSQAIKISGQVVQSAVQLASLIPVQVINPYSLSILEDGPTVRRQFIDWGVFHVEQSFLFHWQRANRALKQRNEMLKGGRIDRSLLAAWDQAFVEHSLHLQALRKSYVERIDPHFKRWLAKISMLEAPDLTLAAGWDERESLEDVLAQSLEQDRRLGFTQFGPHRADIKVRTGGKKAVDILSRGQQKIVVSALKLAQSTMYQQARDRQCIFLVDDLAAELDAEHRQRLYQSLVDTGSQLLITSVEANPFELDSKGDTRVFHVKQGQIAVTAN